MSEHKIKLTWSNAPHAQNPETYSRDHEAVYSDTTRVEASAAPEFMGNAELADPEQLLVNALASCHLLYFLAICEGSGYEVAEYSDEATGLVEKLPQGGFGVSHNKLRPRATFNGEKQPDAKALQRLHDRAHKGCFIANSITSSVQIELED